MKASIWTNYGSPDVLKLQEIPKPIPKANEVLVKIHATTVTTGDCEMRSMKTALLYRIPMRLYTGLLKPKRIQMLGMELAGEIVEIGNKVNFFKKGEQVFAALSYENTGTYTEYKTITQDSIMTLKPKNMTYEEATTVPVGGLEALHYIKQANIKKRQKILIIGAGGTVGTFAIQLAKINGAIVTAVDSSEKLEILNILGADHVIDFTKEVIFKQTTQYDIILDIAGKNHPLESMKALVEHGTYIVANPTFSRSLKIRLLSIFQKKKVIVSSPKFKIKNLLFLKELIEDGKLKTFIDKKFSLEDIQEAHEYVESGKKKGHVVIILNN